MKGDEATQPSHVSLPPAALTASLLPQERVLRRLRRTVATGELRERKSREGYSKCLFFTCSVVRFASPYRVIISLRSSREHFSISCRLFEMLVTATELQFSRLQIGCDAARECRAVGGTLRAGWPGTLTAYLIASASGCLESTRVASAIHGLLLMPSLVLLTSRFPLDKHVSDCK
jgi:hypothetical protein